MCKNVKNAILVFGSTFLNVTALISFYAIFKSIKTAIFFTMPIIIISLVVVIVMLSLQIKTLKLKKREVEAELEEAKAKNTALADQFTKKRKKLDKFEIHWGYLNTVFLNTIQSSKKERFEEAFRLYRTYSDFLNSSEEE